MKPDRTPSSIPVASLDREIEAILSVEPSPEFVSRVRTRISEAALSGWTMGWTSLAAGSAVVAVVVAIAISRPHEPYVIAPQDSLVAAPTRLMRVAPSDDVPASSNMNSVKPHVRHKPRVSKTAFREPQLLINPEEAVAIRHFLANPQPARTELSVVTIEPQSLPEFTFTPLPIFNPMSVMQGDFK